MLIANAYSTTSEYIMTTANSTASNFYASAANTPLAIAYGKARFGTAKAVAASAVAQIGLAQWAQELCASLPKSLIASYAQQARQAAQDNSILQLCPISGTLCKLQLDSSLRNSTSKIRYPLVALNPMVYATLPTAAEAALPLHMLIARLLYIAAQHGIIRITTALPLQEAASNSATKARLIKALPMLQAVVNVSAERAARLPVLALSPELHTASAFANALSVWTLRCYGMLYADYGTSVSDDDTAALAELDALLNADERARLLAQKREDAAVRAARTAAQKRITSCTLMDAASAVCKVMRKVTCDWAHDVHGTKLMQLACTKPTVDAAWYSIISSTLIKYFPDSKIVGEEAYGAYTIIQQHLDMLQLSHSQALAELGLLPEDSNELLRTVLTRYNMRDVSGKHEAKLQASLQVMPAQSTRASVQDSQQKLRTALVQAALVVNATVPTVAPATAADGRKLSIAERIAATRAAQAK